MERNDWGIIGSLSVVTIVMLLLWGKFMSESIRVSSFTVHLYGWVAVVVILVAVGLLLSKVYRLVSRVNGNEDVDTEIVTLIIMIGLLSGCAYWALVINGDYDTTYNVLVRFGGFV